jgi:hypothetical protein
VSPSFVLVVLALDVALGEWLACHEPDMAD